MSSHNILSGFKATGIFPFNPEEIVSKFPTHLRAEENEANNQDSRPSSRSLLNSALSASNTPKLRAFLDRTVGQQ